MRAINWAIVKIETEQRQDWIENAQYWRAKAREWANRGYADASARCIKNAMVRLNWIAQNNRELREQFSRGMY